MILFLVLAFLVLVDLFTASNLLVAARAFFRVSLVFCLGVLLHSDHPMLIAGASLWFGVSATLSLITLRNEVQRDSD